MPYCLTAMSICATTGCLSADCAGHSASSGISPRSRKDGSYQLDLGRVDPRLCLFVIAAKTQRTVTASCRIHSAPICFQDHNSIHRDRAAFFAARHSIKSQSPIIRPAPGNGVAVPQGPRSSRRWAAQTLLKRMPISDESSSPPQRAALAQATTARFCLITSKSFLLRDGRGPSLPLRRTGRDMAEVCASIKRRPTSEPSPACAGARSSQEPKQIYPTSMSLSPALRAPEPPARRAVSQGRMREIMLDAPPAVLKLVRCFALRAFWTGRSTDRVDSRQAR